MGQSIEPKRHHYIPQFILRNFNDKNSQINYWDISAKELQKRNTRSVFMNKNMYRDEVNYPAHPTLIESTLADFEAEISEIINGKLLSTNEVVITRTELEKLRIFLSLLSFRSDSRKDQYQNNKFDEETRKVLKDFSTDDFELLWKKELMELAQCRSYEEIRKNNKIDEIIKTDFFNDLNGMYMTLADSYGGDFVITDIYPTLEIFPIKPKINIHLHCFYPLSPTRILILNHIMFKQATNSILLESMKAFSQIRGALLSMPINKYSHQGKMSPEDEFIYQPQKASSEDVQYISALQLNEARIGIAFQNAEKITDSVFAFNRRTDTKQKFFELENELKK